MSRKRITYIHIFIWLFAIFANLPYANLRYGMPANQIISNIIAFLYLMFAFYLFYLYLVPYFLDRKKIISFFGYSFLIVLLLPFFGYTMLFFVRAVSDGTFHNFYQGYSLKMHMSGYFPVLTAAVFGSFFRVIINWFSTMNQKSDIDRQKLAVELDLIKSKLNPHFLFNTINNIDSLIKKDPDKASESLIRLSEMMRYLTYETPLDYVELNKEADYIENLIELYRLRINSPDDIISDIRGDLSVKVSPAIFVPLIENAFKFAVFGRSKPSIEIHLYSEKDTIIFKISNIYDKYSKTSEKPDSGSGLINLQKRLDLTYPNNHELSVNPGENVYHVKLTININND